MVRKQYRCCKKSTRPEISAPTCVAALVRVADLSIRTPLVSFSISAGECHQQNKQPGYLTFRNNNTAVLRIFSVLSHTGDMMWTSVAFMVKCWMPASLHNNAPPPTNHTSIQSTRPCSQTSHFSQQETQTYATHATHLLPCCCSTNANIATTFHSKRFFNARKSSHQLEVIFCTISLSLAGRCFLLIHWDFGRSYRATENRQKTGPFSDSANGPGRVFFFGLQWVSINLQIIFKTNQVMKHQAR